MAASKTESPPAAASAPAAAAAPAAEPKPAGKMAAFIPLLAVIVLAPALSFAVVQFVMLPQLKKQLVVPLDAKAEEHSAEAASAHEEAESPKEGKEGGHGKKGEAGGAANSYEFANVVVNLSGTMGTRYLKTTFLVTGGDKGLRATFETNKAKLLDVTLNVLSALSLTDLEEAGAKNLIREKLLGAYNQALGKKIVEQVYFSDFVVQ